ncbi:MULTISPECIES: S4 domain-containing protein, partial [unclassified Rickettsia]
MTKIRLDEFLLQKGFAPNIQVAQSLIMQGKVHNKHEQLTKAGTQVNINDKDIKVKLPKHNYVSRGALKL